jgi:3-hydroxyacyl-CoA dehydrogenase / enoyl-CoA hydratase / 3-hydroxybutyryl-CoA epimerase
MERKLMTTSTGTMAAGKAFRFETDAEIGVLWFDLEGEKVNKFSLEVMGELDRTLDAIQGMTEIEKILIVSGKESIFIAGADISQFENVPGAGQAEEFVRRGQNIFRKLARLPQTSIAVIHGGCFGGGTELALNCDFRLITDWEKSSIGLPEVKLGIIPAWTGTTLLPRVVGIPAALDMILTGRNVNAKKAKRMGLADDVIPVKTRLEAAKVFASRQKGKREKRQERIYLEKNPLARRIVFGKARDGVREKTGGHYPAPFRAIDVMETGFDQGIEAGFRAEARAAAELITGEVAPNLVRLFFMMENAKKWQGPPPRKVESVGILGAGLMGGGIAHTLVDKASVPVRLKDINWEALASGMKSAAKIWRKKVERKRLSAQEMHHRLAKITTTLDWTGFASVDVVIEAVVEKIGIKQQVLAEFEEIAKESAVFATNTSTIPITRIAEKAARPENVIGMHFFSPVEKMPLVEVIRGEKTSEETVSTIVELAKRMGKTVVVCSDGPGFIVNRILGPYINEAGMLVEEGNTIESIDQAIKDFGMPLGPLALLDEVGIDVAGKAAEVLGEAFGHRTQASVLVEKLLEDERYGKKNGRGVYEMEKGKRTKPDAKVYELLGVHHPVEADRRRVVERLILLMINEAALILEEKIARSAADVDLAMIMGTGFPPFRGGLLRYADTRGASWVVARMEEYRGELGSRFEPSAPLRRVAEKGSSFYDEWPSPKA